MSKSKGLAPNRKEGNPDGLGDSDADKPRAKPHDISVLVLAASVVKLNVDVLDRLTPAPDFLRHAVTLKRTSWMITKCKLKMTVLPTLEIVSHMIVIVVAES